MLLGRVVPVNTWTMAQFSKMSGTRRQVAFAYASHSALNSSERRRSSSLMRYMRSSALRSSDASVAWARRRIRLDRDMSPTTAERGVISMHAAGTPAAKG